MAVAGVGRDVEKEGEVCAAPPAESTVGPARHDQGGAGSNVAVVTGPGR